jgi:glycosyltransferase involved in cell wall biosynthesis
VGLSAARAVDYVEHAERVLGKHRPAAILATGPPFSTFVAAAILARKLGSRLILDYRDEWTTCAYGRQIYPRGFDKRRERRLERILIGRADAVLMVTESMRDHMLRRFASLHEKECVVVPNGWDPVHYPPDLSDVSPQEDGQIRVSYVGALKSLSGLGGFLADLSDALAKSEDLKRRLTVRFIGRAAMTELEALSRFPIPGIIDRVENQPTPDAIRVMADSDVLLLLTTPETRRALHSKLFYYVAARRPILVYGSRGEAQRLVDSLGAGVFVPSGSPIQLGNALAGLAQRSSTAGSSRTDRWLASHTRESAASLLYDVLDSLD